MNTVTKTLANKFIHAPVGWLQSNEGKSLFGEAVKLLGEKEAKTFAATIKSGLSPLTPVPKVHAAQRSYYDRVLNAAADDDVNAGNLKALRMKYRQKANPQAKYNIGDTVIYRGETAKVDNRALDSRGWMYSIVYDNGISDTVREENVSKKSLGCRKCGKALGEWSGWAIKDPKTGRYWEGNSWRTGTTQAETHRSKQEAEAINQRDGLGGTIVYIDEGDDVGTKSLPGHETKGWGNWLHAIAAVLATLIGDPGLANINLELMGDDLGLDDLYGEGKTPQQAAEVIKPKVRKKMLEVKTKAWYVVDDNGYACEVYMQGPDVGKPSPHNDKASAEKAADRLSRQRGWETEVTDRLPPVKSLKSIDAVMFDAWGTENYNTPLENRKINVRENGGEREITFGQLISMVGHGEAERLWRMAIRKGTGKWHAASESYSPNPREYKSSKAPGNPLMGKFDSFIEQWEAMGPAERLPLLQGAGLSTGLANRDWTGMDRVEQATLLRTHAKGIKSLPDIRMKYRATKRYKKTIRSAKKGTYAFNIHEKDLTSMRADAKAAGCKASWSGGDGSSIRVKLTGSDEAIDGIARKFARRGR